MINDKRKYCFDYRVYTLNYCYELFVIDPRDAIVSVSDSFADSKYLSQDETSSSSVHH